MTGKLEMTLDGITSEVIDNIACRILKVPDLNLSPAEIRIVTLMGQGHSMREIAGTLGLKHASDISNRVHSCCEKNHCTRYQLMVYGAFLDMCAQAKAGVE